MSLTVISPAYYEDLTPCQRLIDSCKYFGLNLHLYGQDEPWPWYYDAKVIRLAQELEELDSEYILVCDADDAFFMAREAEIMDKFLRRKTSILVSADRQQEEGDSKWPQSVLRDLYPQSTTPWRYCNSGGYIGKRESILDLLYKMATLKKPDYIPIYRSKDWNNDQFCMSIAYLEGYPLKIDTACEIFQTMGCVEDGEIRWKGSYMMNRVTGTFPCVVHFNGNAPGIEEAYQKCFALTTTQ